MDIVRKQNFRCTNYVLIIVVCIGITNAVCYIPSEFHTSTWNFESSSESVNGTIRFGTTTASGGTHDGIFKYNIMGDTLNAFTCILSNNISTTDHVLLWRSDNQYFDGDNKRLYLCMKVKIVTKNLGYFHLLSDMNNAVTPKDRVTSYVADPVGSNPCSFTRCTYTGTITDYKILRRDGTSDALPSDVSLCEPCGASCSGNNAATISGTWTAIFLVAPTIYRLFI